MKRTGGVLVAAGMSSRMKEFKPMLPFGSSTIARHIVSMIQDAGVDPVVVVTGYRAQELEEHLSFAGVRFVRNERYRETDMFTSIKLGIKAIEGTCDRVLLMPVDIPAIRPETIRQTMMIDAGMIRTMCKGEPGHPILINREYLHLITDYTGERGLRGAMESSGVPITNFEVTDEGVYRDADTPEEYRELIRWNCNRGGAAIIEPKVQIKLAGTETFFGSGVCELLELINQTGSIQEACQRMNMSYSKGSKMLRRIDSQVGYPVVRRRAGGSGGGGSVLTEQGQLLVINYKKMQKEVEAYTKKRFRKYFGQEFCL